MGGNKNQKKTNEMIDTQSKQIQDEHAADRAQGKALQDEAIINSRGSRIGSQEAIRNFGGANFNSTAQSVDPYEFMSHYNPDYSSSKTQFDQFTKTAGIDEDKMRVAHPTFQGQIDDKGIANQFKAGGTYDEFNKTGGVSDADKRNIRSRSNSVIPAFYNQMNASADRANMVQGGNNPGAQASKVRMARDAATASAANARDTEMGISDKVNEGRRWGAAGMTDSEGALQDMRGRAAGSLDQSEGNIQGTLQGGRMFGASGLFGIDDSTNKMLMQQSLHNSSLGASMASGNADRGTNVGMANANRAYGQGGAVMGAYGDMDARDQDYQGRMLGLGQTERGVTYGGQEGMINARTAGNQGRDWTSWLGAAGGVAAGIGGLGFGGDDKTVPPGGTPTGQLPQGGQPTTGAPGQPNQPQPPRSFQPNYENRMYQRNQYQPEAMQEDGSRAQGGPIQKQTQEYWDQMDEQRRLNPYAGGMREFAQQGAQRHY